jgi:membrane protein
VGTVGEADRQLQQARLRETGQRAMSEPGDDDTEADESDAPLRERDRSGDRWTAEELADLREDLEDLETRIDERTVHRDELEDDLQEYVRWRARRGHARGWGPYLVLLYGTAMTLGAFYFLSGLWAVLAMLVIWLSTLGLYALMLLVGVGINAVTLPGRLKDRFL